MIDSESAVRYEWDFGNGDTSELFSPVVRYENDGTDAGDGNTKTFGTVLLIR